MTTIGKAGYLIAIVYLSLCSTIFAQNPQQDVEIPDQHLRSALRETLSLSSNQPITEGQLQSLKVFHAPRRQIKDLTGLEHAINLVTVGVPYNEFSSLEPLAGLNKLETLLVFGNPHITDISALENLSKLKNINAGGCRITDINPIRKLTELSIFRIQYQGNLENIAPLSNLTKLRILRADGNRIADIRPLANLVQLRELRLDRNRIMDVTPLANLIDLEKLWIADNLIVDCSPLENLNLVEFTYDDACMDQDASKTVEIPDQHLRNALRETLSLSSNQPITQGQLQSLKVFHAPRRQIKDLTGLEHATNLVTIGLPHNEFRSLEPLAGLNNVEKLYIFGNPEIENIEPLRKLTALTEFNAGGCRITNLDPIRNLTNLTSLLIHFQGDLENIEPLSNLTKLRILRADGNRIADIRSLANLVQLRELRLNGNRIVNVIPLTNLVNLEKLWIENNLIVDHSPLESLNFVEFTRDECCEEPRLSIQERLQNRTFPSVFSAWGGIGWSSVLNLKHESDLEQIARHDLWWTGVGGFGLQLRSDDQGSIKAMGNMEKARQERDEFLAINPNMLLLVPIRMRELQYSKFPEDYPHWIRDEHGNIVTGWPGSGLIDFTHPDVQDWIVYQAIAVFHCGLWDGVMFDWWNEDWSTLQGYRTVEQERNARLNIVRRIREATGDNFLIICNGNRRIFPTTGRYINGTFMETLRDDDNGYTYEGLTQIENTLTWAEVNLRSPQINSLEGWGITSEQPDSPTNLRWMRVFTTMGLTHSDGYVLYTEGIQHRHYWYDFWDADLGRPVGEKRVQYENRDGLFIREFTNGWTVYNRSGETQQIQLSEEAIGVESGARGKVHHLPDLDGEIYLKVVKKSPVFSLSIPAGIHAIHISLKVDQINGEDATIDTVGDLYNALGAAVNFIISVGVDGSWLSYLGDESAGSTADAPIKDDTGLIAVMKEAKTLELVGDALGTGDGSEINIKTGNNLVGVPLDPENISLISDLLVEGVAAIAVSKPDGEGFDTITENDKSTDAPLKGGVGYIVVYTGTESTSIPVIGSSWDSDGAVSAAPAVVFNGSQTPVLYVEGGVMDEFDMLSRIPEFSVTVKNLSTGASLDTVLGTELSETSYVGTFVELNRRAAKAGDVLEIAAHTPNPLVGVKSVPRIVVSTEAVLNSRIKLPDLQLYMMPSDTELLANYPNPFNPETWIPYHLAANADVTVTIYNLQGKIVRHLDLGLQEAGYYVDKSRAVHWDGTNENGESVASGVYFYKLDAGEFTSSKRMFIVK